MRLLGKIPLTLNPFRINIEPIIETIGKQQKY
jgi:hypothetical protein